MHGTGVSHQQAWAEYVGWQGQSLPGVSISYQYGMEKQEHLVTSGHPQPRLCAQMHLVHLPGSSFTVPASQGGQL